MFKQHFIKYHDITENTYPRTMALSRHHTLFWYYSVGVIRKLKQMCTKIEYQIKKYTYIGNINKNQKIQFQNHGIVIKRYFFCLLV